MISSGLWRGSEQPGGWIRGPIFRKPPLPEQLVSPVAAVRHGHCYLWKTLTHIPGRIERLRYDSVRPIRHSRGVEVEGRAMSSWCCLATTLPSIKNLHLGHAPRCRSGSVDHNGAGHGLRPLAGEVYRGCRRKSYPLPGVVTFKKHNAKVVDPRMKSARWKSSLALQENLDSPGL